MHYEGNIIRPPSEAGSILLQATVGCSHNKCTFCGAYKGERFKIKSDEMIMADLDFAASHCRRQERLFICDGDAMIIPQKRLVNILSAIREKLPWVTRVGVYANTKSLHATLTAICKGAGADKMIRMGRKVRQAGIRLSLTVLLGVAGRQRSLIHARKTGEVLSAIDPEYVGALSLMLIPGTPLFTDYEAGTFELIGPDEMLMELGTMMAHTCLTGGLFHANHASNYLPIRARLPEDKEATLKLIDAALAGKVKLRSEWMRGL